MHRLFPNLLITVLVDLLLAAPFSVFASEGTPQIELNLSQASLGKTTEVMDGRIEPDASVLLLPLDFVYGHYEFRAIDEQHRIARADLTISSDTSDDDESGQRGEDEPLLAPMPAQAAGTGYSGTAPTPSTTATSPTLQVEPPIPISL